MRDISPTPPTESKEQEKEGTSTSPASARACEAYEAMYRKALSAITGVGGTHRPPRPEHVVTHAENIMAITRDFALMWYETMTEQLWLDRDGKPIGNWAYMLRSWKNGEEYYKAKQALLAAEAKRMGEDAKRGVVRGPGPRKADSWIGSPTNDHALG